MKKSFTAIALVSATLTLSLFCGCTPKNNDEYSSLGTQGYCIGTNYALVITDKFGTENDRNENYKKMQELCAYVGTALSEIESSLSTSVQTSSVSMFNQAYAGEEVEIDKTCYAVLSLAAEMYAYTDGYYNPAVYNSVALYGFAPSFDVKDEWKEDFGEYKLPKEEYVKAFKELSSHFSDIELSEKDGKYYATKPQNAFVVVDEVRYDLKIDLGGIGKGYAVDLINEKIDEYGFEYGYFNFGTSSMAVKKSHAAENGLYNLRHRDPRAPLAGEYLSFELSDSCISTSGDNEKYFIANGERYCHIIDPTTGAPIKTGIMTASVMGGTAAKGDALTTALMAMGKEKAIEFINEKLSDLNVVFACEGVGEYEVYTNIPQGQFAIENQNYKVKNTLDENGKII